MIPTEKPNTYCFPEIECLDTSEFTQHKVNDGQKRLSAQEKLSAIEAEGYEQGRCKGQAKTLECLQTQLEPLSGLLNKSAEMLVAHGTHCRSNSPKVIVQMAVAIASRLVENHLRQEPDSADHIIETALQCASEQEKLKIKVNPSDVDRMLMLLKQVMPSLNQAEHYALTSDPIINQGGCLIETDFGTIDGRIDQQVATIATALENALEECCFDFSDSDEMTSIFKYLNSTLEKTAPIKIYGHVTKVVGLVVEANGPAVQLGSLCDIYGNKNSSPIAAEVLGFRDRTVLMMPLEELRAIGPGSRVVARQPQASAAVGDLLLGRVIDGLGNPIDGKGPVHTTKTYPLYANPINPLLRKRIRTPLDIGVRAINGLLTIGCGQRMGIFAGSGVGKSVLMGMIARKSEADVNVIALIGERGRELNEFIDKDLGAEGLKKSVVIVATSDHLPLVRVRGAFVASAIAEFFRDQGLTVNLMMDSLTRFAMAQREIGLSLGEPPTTKGYTPSVFTLLPKLLERAGTSDHSGSITGLYTVLVEGDDMNDPIADAARSILDGHVVLSRDLAAQNHYPAIDVLKSISRVMEDIMPLQHKHNAGRMKEMLATYNKAEDLINIGAYVSGSNPAIDRSIANIDFIKGYLSQDIVESISMEESVQQLDAIINTK